MNLKSKLEQHSLETLELNKKKFNYTFTYESVKLPYVLHKLYIPDWTVNLPSGKSFFIEMKGYLRPSDRTKLKAVLENNKGVDLRIVFSKDNKLNKNSKTTYSQWAAKNNIPWAIGSIPLKWFKHS